MTVQELIDKLRRIDPSKIVIVGRDDGGEYGVPLERVATDNLVYVEEKSDFFGWVAIESLDNLTDEQKNDVHEYTEDDVHEGQKVVVLVPVR